MKVMVSLKKAWDTMNRQKFFDVIVIGSGITGLSSLYHLTTMGVKRLALATTGLSQSQSLLASGGSFGSPSDNYTRWCHHHGSIVAQAYWRWNHEAFEALLQFADSHGLMTHRGRRIRVATTVHEWKEMQDAVLLLQRDGFAADLKSPETEGLPLTVPGVQIEGLQGAFVDPHQLIDALSAKVHHIPKLPAVTRIHQNGDHVRVQCIDGTTISAEIMVIAAHFGTCDLLPQLGPALIPVADQWSVVAVPPDFFPRSWPPGTVFSLNHGHEWGVLESQRVVRMGGARYLRPMEGIEAVASSTNGKIVEHLRNRLSVTLGRPLPSDDPQFRALHTVGLLDIKPCDELPVVGPLFGEPRILVATGFAAQGAHLGFFAGFNLAELITQGRSSHLPRSLWPERLRSLAPA